MNYFLTLFKWSKSRKKNEKKTKKKRKKSRHLCFKMLTKIRNFEPVPPRNRFEFRFSETRIRFRRVGAASVRIFMLLDLRIWWLLGGYFASETQFVGTFAQKRLMVIALIGFFQIVGDPDHDSLHCPKQKGLRQKTDFFALASKFWLRNQKYASLSYESRSNV